MMLPTPKSTPGAGGPSWPDIGTPMAEGLDDPAAETDSLHVRTQAQLRQAIALMQDSRSLETLPVEQVNGILRRVISLCVAILHNQTRLHTKIRTLQHQMDTLTWRCSEIRLSTQDRFQGILFLTQCHANQQFLLEEVRGIKEMLIEQGFSGL